MSHVWKLLVVLSAALLGGLWFYSGSSPIQHYQVAYNLSSFVLLGSMAGGLLAAGAVYSFVSIPIVMALAGALLPAMTLPLLTCDGSVYFLPVFCGTIGGALATAITKVRQGGKT
ncbi:MAG: hypothetical protein KDA93_24195 [Planctomycetaceae bacterium]|nr:hypothetical protein [Planctomycetaceae bacterium]